MHQRHEINSIIFKQLSQSKIVKAFGGYKIWSCKAISLKKYMHFFRPLPPLAIPSQPSEHTPAELAGEGCTLEMMLNGFNGQPRSLRSGSIILRQVQYICSHPTCGSKVEFRTGSKQFKTIASGASFSAAGVVLHRSSVGNSCICTLGLFTVLS